jgi:hypothetical protein
MSLHSLNVQSTFKESDLILPATTTRPTTMPESPP